MFNFFNKFEAVTAAFNLRPKTIYYPQVPFFLDLRNRLPRSNLNKLSVLNVGVGVGNSGLAMQLPYFDFYRLDHLDVHLPYLEAAKSRTWAAREMRFINASIVGFNTTGYDYVLMFDILEHLPKDDALEVMDKIKCCQVIFIPLEKQFRKNDFGAESQDHKSLWREYDFIHRGYVTEVLTGFHRDSQNSWDALWALK